MKHIFIFLLSLSFAYLPTLKGQPTCPACTITLPNLPEDTLFLGTAADGQVDMAYDEDISFRVPMTTTPVAAVDTTVPPNLAIEQFTIVGVSNLPPGLSWEASQTTFITAMETDGCVKICGIPLQAGLYQVEVGLKAQVAIISQTTSFSFPIYIAPAISRNDGFTMENSTACGATTVSFQNNIVSNGQEGFSYSWDFGNGNTSLAENPVAQAYSEPGVYPIHYQAIVDTTGFLLTHVRIESASCNDLVGQADLYFELTNPDGALIYTSSSIENMNPPVSFDLLLEIQTGNYSMQVFDQDSGIAGADDDCGTINFNQLSSGSLTNGDLTVGLTIIHPVDTIITMDSVVVYEVPAAPEVTFNGSPAICEGESITLTASYFDNVQWFKDTLPLVGENKAVLLVTQAGNYWVEYRDENGCSAVSEEVAIEILANPEIPNLSIENNLLFITNPEILATDYRFQWYLDGTAIEGATEMEYCIAVSGMYHLEIITASGCSNRSATLNIVYNEDFPNCVSSTNDFLASSIGFQMFPNPAKEHFYLSFQLNQSEDVFIKVMDVLGRTVFSYQESGVFGNLKKRIDSSNWTKGFYLVELRLGKKQLVEKLLLQ